MSRPFCPYADALKSSVFRLAKVAFAEDLPDGDATSGALELRSIDISARIICRQAVVMNGSFWFEEVRNAFRAQFGKSAPEIKAKAHDGDLLSAGSVLFDIFGASDGIMALERTFLNFLTRGIGIANLTRQFVNRVRDAGCDAAVMDTRKTLPGFRMFDKYAVLCGGGTNHRMSLSDQVLIKENHIAAFGGIGNTLAQVRKSRPDLADVIIEVRNTQELQEAIDAQCPVVMLDNFAPELVRQVCQEQRGKTKLEVSGGISLENVEGFCHPGLDRMSIGTLTHSVIAPDITLLVRESSDP